MRILFISTWFPYPPDNGSKIRAFHLLRRLASRHEITLLTFAQSGDGDPVPAELGDLCDSIRVVTRRPFQPDRSRARLGFLSATPRSLVDTRSVEMEQAISDARARQAFDVAIACQLPAAFYAPALAGIPSVAEEMELGVLHDQARHAPGLGHRLRYGLTWWKHRRYLATLLPHFDLCTVASRVEKELLERFVPAAPRVHVVPNALPLAEYAKVTEAKDPEVVVFAGALSYFANLHGIEWFVAEALPRIVDERPEARLVVTGDPAGVRLGAAPSVRQTGHIADARPLVAAASVAIAPILEGGGTRLKILEAMALGTPVVSTRKGAEGLEVEAGEHLLLADDPDEFAHCVLRLLADRELSAKLVDNARSLIARRYDWEIVGRYFEQLVTEVAERRR